MTKEEYKDKLNLTIIQEMQDNVKQFEWQCLNDITEAINQMTEDCYIIYIDSEGETCLADTVGCMQVFGSRENRKFLLIPQKLYQKLDEHLIFIANFGTVEEMIEIGNSLYKLYPDFNFFEI